MHSSLFSLPLAGIVGLGVSQLILIAVIVAFPMFILAIVASALYFKHQRQKLWHETARLALEKGQPLPPMSPEKKFDHERQNLNQHDLRAGLILIAAGAGIFLFFNAVAGPQVAYLGVIPGFVGVALLLHSIITKLSAPKNSDSKLPPA